MNRSPGTIIGVGLGLLLALFGLAVSYVLLQHHVQADAPLSGVCEISETSSCDEVLASEWGKIAGLPTSLWGLFFFAAMASWFLVVGRPDAQRRRLQLLPVVASGVGTVFCIILAVIMYGTLDKWCPLCAVTHVTTLLLFLVTLALWSRASKTPASSEVPEQADGALTAVARPFPGLDRLVIAAVLAGATSYGGWADYQARLYHARWLEYDKNYQAAYEYFARQKKHDIPVTENDSIRGDVDAPHTVIVFSDFHCPFCRVVERMIDKQLEARPGWFRVVFKHFPMDKTCNERISRTLHAAACAAAVTAEAARLIKDDDDAFWYMHDAFFAHQDDFPGRIKAFVEEQAAEIGITSEELWDHIRSYRAWDRVKEHVEQGHELGIKGTPKIYFDGRELARWADEQFWAYMHSLDERAGQPVIPPAREAVESSDEPEAESPEDTPSPGGAATRPGDEAPASTQPSS